MRGGVEARAPELSEERGDRDRASRRRAARPGGAAARPGGRRAAGGAARDRALGLRRDLRPAEAAAAACSTARRERGRRRRSGEEAAIEGLDLPAREAEQRVRSAPRAAPSARSCSPRSRSSRPGTATSSRSRPAPTSALVHVDRLEELREDGTLERMLGAERAAERVRETWRAFEEFQLSAGRCAGGALRRAPPSVRRGVGSAGVRTVAFGRTGLEITPVGFGAWAIGGGNGSSAGARRTTTSRSRRSSGRWSSGSTGSTPRPHYGFGHSEEVVGRALEGVEPRPLRLHQVRRSWRTEPATSCTA